eukprot:TRINITY_DN289_c0_g1_i2.p3 TRINITY_DN289_c0_g1~~TRINITY_DN289_c0_g1_i2.p3  ORF type:complete len:112 (+),score=32.20 TRINITY_DN289_c0_g1_i2:540-875(+)
MFGWGESEKHHDAVWNTDTEELKKHSPSKMHEMIAGAAGFAAMQAYMKHEAENGKPQSWAFVKELIAGFAASQVDKMIEQKGMDWVDGNKAKEQAIAQAHALAEEKYSGGW